MEKTETLFHYREREGDVLHYFLGSYKTPRNYSPDLKLVGRVKLVYVDIQAHFQ